MSEQAAVRLERRGEVLWAIIDREARRNAINEAVISGLAQGLRQAEDDRAIRAVVVTGAGDKAFCAGGDLNPQARSFEFDASRPNTGYADLLRQAHACTVPIVARINGTCMAGGMGLLAMADMAIAAEHALFGLPEVKIGLFPMQVLSVLQHLVPPRRLAEMCITGEPFPAAEALAMGLVNYVVPAAELDAKLDWLLARVVDKSPTAIRRGKYAMRVIADQVFEGAIAYTEGQIATLAMTEDAREGMRAFVEKRKPVWTGR